MSKLNEMTDEELALAYVGGDNRAFDLLLSRNEVKLFSYILFVVHDEDLANDIFQETFVKAISRLHAGQYSSSGKFSSWLMRIAHNVIIDGYRSQCVFRMVEQGTLPRILTHPVAFACLGTADAPVVVEVLLYLFHLLAGCIFWILALIFPI